MAVKLSVYSKGGLVGFIPACFLPPADMDHRMSGSRLSGSLTVPEPPPAEWADIVDEVEQGFYALVPLERAILLLVNAPPRS